VCSSGGGGEEQKRGGRGSQDGMKNQRDWDAEKAGGGGEGGGWV